MLDAEKLRELEAYISILELQDSSFDGYAKLADLYAIRDHQGVSKPVESTHSQSYSTASAPANLPRAPLADSFRNSDFLQAVSGKDSAAVWTIMDDLMDTLRATNTRVYNSVMDKIMRL